MCELDSRFMTQRIKDNPDGRIHKERGKSAFAVPFS